MRQNAFIFDIDNNKIGVARSECNKATTIIQNEQDFIDYGTDYGIDKGKVSKRPVFVEQVNNKTKGNMTSTDYPKIEGVDYNIGLKDKDT